MRLDRFISHATGMSRREARALVRHGVVTVDGCAVADPGYALTESARVVCEGRELRLGGPVYLMMNKPLGVLSATRDAAQATVVSLLPDDLAARVHPVGRLDKDTSGLLLLTDDGAWSHRITSPRSHCPKVYLADLAEPLIDTAQGCFERGILLRDDDRPTRPAALQRIGDMRARVILSEGRYHQVRRMFAALGNRVTALHREQIGGLSLDADLSPGQWRELHADERDSLCQTSAVD